MIRTWIFAALLFLSARAETPPPLAIESFQAAWEIIRDTHFDTNYNGLNWNAVRAEFLPKIEKSKSPDEVRDQIQAMLDKLGHSHLMIIPGTPPRQNSKPVAPQSEKPSAPTVANGSKANDDRPQNGAIGVEVRVLDGQIVVFRVDPGSSAEKAGLKPGAILHEIDGEPALDPTVHALEHSPRQRDFLLWHNAAHLLKGAVGEHCELIVENVAGKKEKLSIPRVAETGLPAKLGNLPLMYTRTVTNELQTASGKRIGYLRFNLWMVPAVLAIDRFVEEYRNADGIVIDLRGNLGGIGGMVIGTAGHFLNERASLGTMKMRDNELTFTAFPRRVNLRQQPTNTFQGKLAVLIDPITLSSAELFAGGMKELGRARLFGEPTGGQALPSVSDRLPNGDLLYHAVADFTTPKGHRLEGPGVTPDENIPLRLDALRAGRDDPLAAALKWLDAK